MKSSLLCAALVIPLYVLAQELPPQEAPVAAPVSVVPIRSSPPSVWLFGFPGWEIAETDPDQDKKYTLVRTREIRAFSSTQVWAHVEWEG